MVKFCTDLDRCYSDQIGDRTEYLLVAYRMWFKFEFDKQQDKHYS